MMMPSPTPSPGPNRNDFLLHGSYTFWISRLANLLQDEFNKRLQAQDVSWPQWMVLNVLAQGLAGTPAGVADIIGVDRSAVTRLLDRLERKGLVLREHAKLDRRSVNIHMTEVGKTLMQRLDQLAREHQEHFLSSMHATEHRSFKGNIQKMLKLAGVDSLRLWK